MAQNIRIVALHPKTGKIVPAVYKEDWFGPGKDAISFLSTDGVNMIFSGPNYSSQNIEWDFVAQTNDGAP